MSQAAFSLALGVGIVWFLYHGNLVGETDLGEVPGDETEAPVERQTVLNLLYLIAEDQAHRTGYAHRGVTCNTCGITPIHGARYHCSECVDVDLCQYCEKARRHHPLHILVRIDVPIPILQSPRWIRPSVYCSAIVRAHETLDSQAIPYDGQTLAPAVAARFSASYSKPDYVLNAKYAEFMTLVDGSLPDDDVPYGISERTLRNLLFPCNPECLLAGQVAKLYDSYGDGVCRFEDYLRIAKFLEYGTRRDLIQLSFDVYNYDESGIVNEAKINTILDDYLTTKLLEFSNRRLREYKPLRSDVDLTLLRSARPLSSAFESDTNTAWPMHPQTKHSVFEQQGSPISLLRDVYSAPDSRTTQAENRMFGSEPARALRSYVDWLRRMSVNATLNADENRTFSVDEVADTKWDYDLSYWLIPYLSLGANRRDHS